jgi:lysyl-tRNA synthetase class 1
MLKRFVGTRAISVMDIPRYMNEFDELEDIYFSEKKIENKKELAKLQGLYEYLWWLKPPSQSSVHVPYNLLVYLAKVAPKESEPQYITEKLKEYHFLEEKKELTSNLEERIRYALNWTQDFREISEGTIKLGSEERQAIEELMQIMQTEMDADQVQGAVFNLARKYNIQPGQFFRTLYTILLGTPTGPRLGPYLVAMGRKNVLDALERALGK